MRFSPFILAVPLLLAACAPVDFTPAPGGGPPVTPIVRAISPQEAEAIVIDATNTAAAVATRDAQAAATEQRSHDLATEARQATLDALAGLQTESALQLTQAAGQSMSTDMAQERTQAADETRAWATPTAAAMRAQASGTDAAMRSQATAQADQLVRRRDSDASAAEFWQTIRLVIVVLAIVGGLTAIAVVGFDRVTAVRLARLASQAAIAREAFRLLPPGHWAEWRPGDGYQVYTLPGQLDAPATIIENATPSHNTAHDWRQAVRLFCWWGERYGFGIRELGPAGAGVVTDPDWRRLAQMLKAAGVLADVTLPGKKGKTTGWAAEWGYLRLHDDLGHGRLALPFPTDAEAPKVAFAVPNTTPQEAQHNTATQERA